MIQLSSFNFGSETTTQISDRQSICCCYFRYPKFGFRIDCLYNFLYDCFKLSIVHVLIVFFFSISLSFSWYSSPSDLAWMLKKNFSQLKIYSLNIFLLIHIHWFFHRHSLILSVCLFQLVARVHTHTSIHLICICYLAYV